MTYNLTFVNYFETYSLEGEKLLQSEIILHKEIYLIYF